MNARIMFLGDIMKEEKINHQEGKRLDDCETEVQELINVDYFRALLDPVRMEIVKYLSIYGSKSINEIAENFTQDRSVISRHLDLLYRQGILSKRKESRYTIYEVDGIEIANRFEEAAMNIRMMIKKYDTC